MPTRARTMFLPDLTWALTRRSSKFQPLLDVSSSIFLPFSQTVSKSSLPTTTSTSRSPLELNSASRKVFTCSDGWTSAARSIIPCSARVRIGRHCTGLPSMSFSSAVLRRVLVGLVAGEGVGLGGVEGADQRPDGQRLGDAVDLLDGRQRLRRELARLRPWPPAAAGPRWRCASRACLTFFLSWRCGRRARRRTRPAPRRSASCRAPDGLVLQLRVRRAACTSAGTAPVALICPSTVAAAWRTSRRLSLVSAAVRASAEGFPPICRRAPIAAL